MPGPARHALSNFGRMRLAGIDIGSNAVRCLVAEVLPEHPIPIKLKLLRIPIRLGLDTFLQGSVSEYRLGNLTRTLKMFRLLMDIYEVEHYRACATSAMRDADNRDEMLAHLAYETGIQIDIIDGREEASIIFENRSIQNLDPRRSYMFIDVGGGSTDISVFARDKPVLSRSFNIGTLRLMHGQVDSNSWNKMKLWVQHNLPQSPRPVAVGSGGNINSILQISRRRKGQSMSYEFLNAFCKEINDLSVDERMERFLMKPDRADVIGHACSIYTSLMKWSSSQRMVVPQVGLADGMIKQLADKHLFGGGTEISFH